MSVWTASFSKSSLPSLAVQSAYLAGERGWKGEAKAAPVVSYEDGRVWFVARTNPRCEGRAMATLGARGFETFLPVGKKTIIHHRSKRAIEREFPLMVGYLFLAMPMDADRRHWGVVRACDGVHGILGMGERYVAVPEREVMVLMDAEADGRLRFEAAKRRAGKHGYVDGMEAEIAMGPFSGFVGQVIDASCQKAIRLLITIFGRMTEVVVPVDELRAV